MQEKKLFSKIKSGIRHVLITDEVFWQNEVEANMLLARISIFSAVVLIATNVLNYAGVYKIPSQYLNVIVLQGLFELLIPAGLCFYYKGQKRWLKWLMLFMLTFVYARVYTAISYRTSILMVLPVLISCRYYSRRLTEIVSMITTVVFFLAAVCSKTLGSVDMNIISVASPTEYSVSVKAILLRSFLPTYILFWIAAIASYNIAYRGRKMILEQDKVSQNQSRIETELSMAKQIQKRALPLIPDLPQHEEYDLAASMTPAKEVGGDFYDFLFIDPTHLAIVIADVSGKGVPAALFMMVSKILLANRIMLGGRPGEILADVNNQLCSKKLEDMFVTVWLAIVDLTNGHVITANAGHEYPFLRKNSQNFELLKDTHGLVLGGYPGMKYKETEFDLAPGDTLFVYTDGVPEANNSSGELFTAERTNDVLNRYSNNSMEDLLLNMKKEIDAFANGTEQFDDITMVGFQLRRYMNKQDVTQESSSVS